LAFLKVFAAVNGPQQLYKCSLLLSVFTCFVSHQDNATAQAALSCVLKFKQPFVTPYAEQLRGMLKKGELRDTMLKFNMSKEAKAIDSEHRASLLPLVTRILFGRLSAHVTISKASKETPSARRAAVMSFLSVLDGNDDELYPLFYLMVRNYFPSQNSVKPVEKQDEDDRQNALVWLESMQVDDVSHLRNQRHEGFLNLLSSGIAQLGHDIEKFVPAFMSILLALSKYSQVKQSADVSDGLDVDETEEEIEDKSRGPTSRKGVVRTLCFRRLAELHEKFASSTGFLPYAKSMWESLAVSVHELPVTVAYADKAPALLCLLQTLSSHPRLIPILAEHDDAVPSVMKCIADTSKPSVANTSLDFVDNLLTNGGEETDEDFAAADSVGVKLIQKHLSLLLHQFAIRLGSKNLKSEQSSRTLANSELTNGVHSHYTRWRELSILCRVSGLVVRSDRTVQDSHEGVDEREVLHMLCELLLPFLSPDRRISEVDQLNVIGILSSLFPRIGREAARSHLPTLSRLLGPYKGRRGISSLAVRKSVASVIQTIPNFTGERNDLEAVAGVTVRLCAVHSKRVDEIDSDEVVAALSELGTTDKSSHGWLPLSGTPNEAGPTILSPLIYLCFHFLYDEDGVVSRAAFQALKSLIFCAAQETMNEDRVTVQMEPSETPNTWMKLIETSVVPVCRSGLTSRSQPIRRLFILIFAEVARRFKEYSSPNLYGDLSCLIRDDDPDLDFFLNVTHVQIHRRSRAFQRLCKMLSESEETRCPFSMQSLSSVLLPLAMHPIYESKTRAEEAFALDAVETVGAIARHLSWSKYHTTLWTLLTQFERHKEQERYLVEAICSVIDAFHFNLVGETDIVANEDVVGDGNNAVWRALERRIIPKTESLLMKEKADRRGGTVKSLRPSVVLALLKLFRKFPVYFFKARLTRLLVVICDALKSKDSDARDVARKTLAKMTAEMDISYLHEVIRQLAVTLTEGYRLHVRIATLHSILQELAKRYKPQQVTSSEKVPETPFDGCIPAMMDLIQQDIFGTAREHKETDGAKKRLVKEATGSKSMDSIELICRMLLFKPSSHAAGAKSVSAVHAVVSPFLQRLRTPDIDTSTIGRIGECLTRVVVGLSHNETVTPDEVLPFVYASIAPFVGEYHAATIAGDKSDDDSSGDEEFETDIQISRTGTSGRTNPSLSNQKNHKKGNASNVVEWRPSTLNVAQNSGDAREMKKQLRVDLHRVRDGASAPKLTGSNRIVSAHLSSTQGLNDPAGISAVTFGLSLLNSSLKKAKFDASDNVSRGMLDPFIPMLTTCVCGCRNNDAILLSLRCLGVLLRVDLPSVQGFSATLGTETLEILTSCGNISNLHQELTQGCFKTLTLLISLDAAQASKSSSWSTSVIDNGESVLQTGKAMPLDANQMQVLISLLKAAVVESDHHHPTLALIKAIVSRQFVSSEFYDLMDTMLDLSVRSQKATLRQVRCPLCREQEIT
jgi:U3 small nucleolar RNA-associated protein 20